MNFTFVCWVEILKHDIYGNTQVAEKIWEDVLFLFKVFLFFKPLYSDFFLPCFFFFFYYFYFLELVRQLLSPSGPLLKQSWHLSNGKKSLLTTHLQTGLHSQGPFLVLYGWLRSAAFPCRNLSTSATSRRRSCPGLHPVWLWPLARFAPSYYAAVWIYSI